MTKAATNWTIFFIFICKARSSLEKWEKENKNRCLGKKRTNLKKAKGVVLPNDAFQDMHSLRVEKLLEEFIRYNLFFMVLEGFLHFLLQNGLLIYFFSGIRPPVNPPPFLRHYRNIRIIFEGRFKVFEL